MQTTRRLRVSNIPLGRLVMSSALRSITCSAHERLEVGRDRARTTAFAGRHRPLPLLDCREVPLADAVNRRRTHRAQLRMGSQIGGEPSKAPRVGAQGRVVRWASPEFPQRGAGGCPERHRASAFPTPGSLCRGLHLLGHSGTLLVVRARVASLDGSRRSRVHSLRWRRDRRVLTGRRCRLCSRLNLHERHRWLFAHRSRGCRWCAGRSPHCTGRCCVRRLHARGVALANVALVGVALVGIALILSERHLERVARYAQYFNAARPHQGLGRRTPVSAGTPANTNGRVIATPVLGGLHHDYRRVA